MKIPAKHKKQAIIIFILSICSILSISIYFLKNDITTSGGNAMMNDGGTIQSINGVGLLFILGVLIFMLLAIIFSK